MRAVDNGLLVSGLVMIFFKFCWYRVNVSEAVSYHIPPLLKTPCDHPELGFSWCGLHWCDTGRNSLIGVVVISWVQLNINVVLEERQVSLYVQGINCSYMKPNNILTTQPLLSLSKDIGHRSASLAPSLLL